MSNPEPGEIWLVRFPFTDLISAKVRPALIWARYRQDAIILGIFSKIPTGTVSETCVLIADQHPSFIETGLNKSSLLRAEKIATVHESVFQKKIGNLPSDLLQQTQQTLRKTLNLYIYPSQPHSRGKPDRPSRTAWRTIALIHLVVSSYIKQDNHLISSFVILLNQKNNPTIIATGAGLQSR
jgi:mRNA interferase MazF